MNKLSILKFSDDNHSEKIWLNGEYIGDTSSIFSTIVNSIDIIKNLDNKYKVLCDTVYICDDFEDVDENIVDTIVKWFNYVEEITENQLELIERRNWEKLYKEIK